jgi:hypothetical protein
VFFSVRCSAPCSVRTSQHHFHSLLIRLSCCLPGLNVTLCSITLQLPEHNQCVGKFSGCIKCIEWAAYGEVCPSACPIFETTDQVSMTIGIWDSRPYTGDYRVILILVGRLYFVDHSGLRSKAVTWLLGSWVRIPLRAWVFVSFVRCVRAKSWPSF